MRLHDVSENEQTLQDDTPIFDNTELAGKFEGFKV